MAMLSNNSRVFRYIMISSLGMTWLLGKEKAIDSYTRLPRLFMIIAETPKLHLLP